MIGELLEFIFCVLKSVWGTVKKFFVRVFEYAKFISEYFDSRERKSKYRDPAVLAAVVKVRLDEGAYNTVSCLDLPADKYHVVSCFYDQNSEEVVDANDMQYVSADELDAETIEKFNGKDLLILG